MNNETFNSQYFIKVVCEDPNSESDLDIDYFCDDDKDESIDVQIANAIEAIKNDFIHKIKDDCDYIQLVVTITK